MVDGSVGAPEASDAPVGRESSVDVNDASTRDDASDVAVPDANDATSGPPPGCFHYTQGSSGYTASVPRIAPGGDLAQVWAASSGTSAASLFARFGAADGGYSPVALAPIAGSWRGADVARVGSYFASVYTTVVGDGGNSIFFLTFDGGATSDSGA
jgi:hypothetical protein